MPRTIGRTFHDNTPYSRSNQKLEIALRMELLGYVNQNLIPYLRRKTSTDLTSIHYQYADLIKPYIKASYRLGESYVYNITDHERVNSDVDEKMVTLLHKTMYDNFGRKINSLINMQRTENRRDYQIIAGEKERIVNDLSSEIIWKSYNSGIKTKGKQLNMKGVASRGLVYIERKIRSKDLTRIEPQKIFIARIKPREVTHQIVEGAPLSMPELERFLRSREELKSELVFVLVTQKDEKVCEFCRDLETETWTSGDPDLPDPPIHENCRCHLMLTESEFDSE
jgi:hypothetical protein